MNAKLIATVLVAGAFAGGLWIGGQGDKTVISDGTRNTSYEGGFRADTVTTGGAAAVYEGGAAHVVKDGESIQAAVNAAQQQHLAQAHAMLLAYLPPIGHKLSTPLPTLHVAPSLG